MSPYYCQGKTLREKRMAIRQWFLGASCRFLIVGLIVFFGSLFVWKTGVVSTKGYDLNDYERELQAVQEENQRLQLAIAQAGSLKSIEERLPQLGLVAVDQVQYAAFPGTAMALR